MRRALWTLALLAAGVVHAAEPSPTEVLATAVQKLEDGDLEGVVTTLRPIAENGGIALNAKQDRIEALRDYGIACALLQRRAAAEGAFLLLLEEKPDIHFDPRLVRPEAVALLESVRAHFPPLPKPPKPPMTREMKAGLALLLVGSVGSVASSTALSVNTSDTASVRTILPLTFTCGGLAIAGVGVGLLIHSAKVRKH